MHQQDADEVNKVLDRYPMDDRYPELRIANERFARRAWQWMIAGGLMLLSLLWFLTH